MRHFLAGLFLVLLNGTWAHAGSVIIVPPDIFYPAGYEEIKCPDAGEALCQNRQQCQSLANTYESQLGANLAAMLYIQMGDGLRLVNESAEARLAGKRFKVKTVSSPNCMNNLRIKSFYRSQDDPDFLAGIVQRHGVEIVVWADFPVRNILQCGEKSLCQGPVKVRYHGPAAEGNEVVFLDYDSERKIFSRDSQVKLREGLKTIYLNALVPQS